jgi:hypothetical protein
MQMYISAFPDLHFRIDQLLPSGDHVVSRYSATGTHNGDLMDRGEKVTSEVVNADGTSTTTQYTANFDGKDYPLTGSLIADMVSLKRIDARTTERTDKKGGTVAQTIRRVVSADGKTMNVK